MTHKEYIENWYAHRDQYRAAYTRGERSYIPNLLPETALGFTLQEVMELLGERLGEAALRQALDPAQHISGPQAGASDSSWLQRSNMVGVNVRTIGSFWRLLPYALTLPACHDSIHLLPVWEPGVVASLYGMAGWEINPEFYAPEMAAAFPELNTPARQLKAVVNILHALGRSVGMDVIPHTDRFSEIVLANPHFFEWLRRRGEVIVDHRANLHLAVQDAVLEFLAKNGSAVSGEDWPDEPELFFSSEFTEAQRRTILFGPPADYSGRNRRRGQLLGYLYQFGYEPAPATMAPPYRGLEVDPDPETETRDEAGRSWREYRITQPREMSRVFGPLTRYKLYERLDDNRNWQIDFDRPRREVWAYLCAKYAEVQAAFGFDFMRGDMSHVQMRPEGVPFLPGEYYDIHGAIKRHIRKQAPWFGYFAESFLAGPDYMAYGEEVDHLEHSEADTTLGDLQSMVVGSDRFLRHFRWYLDLQTTRQVKPCFTIMTADKDDPRFDQFYLAGNEARLFIGLFATDLPSYLALGFETRDPHPMPAPNEHYTKLFVFNIGEGPKATRGPYVWGKNGPLFFRLSRIRQLAEELLPAIRRQNTRWLLLPDPTGARHVIAWTQREDPRYLFLANLHPTRVIRNLKTPAIDERPGALLHSTHAEDEADRKTLLNNGKHYQLDRILPGECLAYALRTPGE